MKRWTVVTKRGAFLVHATTAANARKQIERKTGLAVVEVRERGYQPPKRKGAEHDRNADRERAAREGDTQG